MAVDSAYPGSLPSRVRRSRRDWVVDVVVFLLSVLLGGLLLLVASLPMESPGFRAMTPVLTGIDIALGASACVALWWRRQAPLVLALVVSGASMWSASSFGAACVLIFTVALHRRWPATVYVVLVNLVVGVAYWFFWTDGTLGWTLFLTSMVAGAALLAACVALGMFTRARRELIASLRERAERAEGEQQRSVHAARLGERTRIAREMHDVLAHRISLVSMHAGALEYRTDATAAEVSTAAGVIRDNAHLALEDLRQVIGVLRSDPEQRPGGGSEAETTRPQPSLSALPALVADTRGTGVSVRETVHLPADDEPPATTSRTAYRVLQEGLTNARKHGRGGVVDVFVDGRPGDGLVVEVVNALRPGGGLVQTHVPGSGNGLVGLAERTRLVGGRMEHGVVDDAFRLRVWLPWQ